MKWVRYLGNKKILMTFTEVVSNSMEGLKFLYVKFLSVQISAAVHAQDIEMMGNLIKC